MIHVTEIPNQLGGLLGISINPSESGACRVLFDADAVDFQTAGHTLFLIADLGSFKGCEEECAALLRANCCGAETLGAVIGLDADRQMLTLHMMLTGALEEEEFKALLAAFLKAVRYWKAWVAADPDAGDDDEEKAEAGTSSGFLAV